MENTAYSPLSATLKQNLKAIIIGVTNYPNPNRNNLHGTGNDAQCLADFLKNEWKVPEENIHLLKETVHYQDALHTIEEICTTMESHEHLLFFYAGHGIIGDGAIKGKTYLTFSDISFKYIDGNPNIENVIPLKYLNDLFLKCKAKIKVRIFDCCHSGEGFSSLEDYFKKASQVEVPSARGLSDPLQDGRELEVSSRDLNAADMEEKGLSTELYNDLMTNQTGWVTFCSCNVNETSEEWVYEDGDRIRGLFSYYFIKGLQNKSFRQDDGPFYIEDLKMYVYRSMLDDYYKKPYHRKPQHMQYQCSLSGNLLLE